MSWEAFAAIIEMTSYILVTPEFISDKKLDIVYAYRYFGLLLLPVTILSNLGALGFFGPPASDVHVRLLWAQIIGFDLILGFMLVNGLVSLFEDRNAIRRPLTYVGIALFFVSKFILLYIHLQGS